MPRRGRNPGILDGCLIIDKAAGMTSHDVVAILRRQLNERRIGHAGTLDPDATGVLVVGVGRSTRLMRFVTGADKAYEGEVVFGTTTSTLDSSGEVTGRFEMDGLSLERVRAAAKSLTGRIAQVPPMVSAVKIDGKRLYELARAGEEVDRKARQVEVSLFEVEATAEAHVVSIKVECSSGTYVRALAADLGEALGGGAHLRALRRSRVGPFSLAGAIDPRTASAEEVLAPVTLLKEMDRFVVDEPTAVAVRHGRLLDARALEVSGMGPWAVIGEEGHLLAVYERASDTEMKPILVHSVASPESDSEASAGNA